MSLPAAAVPPGSYTARHVEQVLGLSKSVVAGLIDAGFVAPLRGPRNERRFSFQDLLLLRTAHALQQAHIAPRKILRALSQLRSSLPDASPLTGLRICAVGNDVVVRDRSGPWTADGGQAVMDFELADLQGAVAFIEPATAVDDSAQAWFTLGEQREQAGDAAAAEAAYRQAITRAPADLHAHLNLGALLCDDGRSAEAAALYAEAVSNGVDHALLHFNHAIALEDLGRAAQALDSYRQALQLDPELADAHYNAGRLLEQQGDARGALRHFSAYRRLQRSANS